MLVIWDAIAPIMTVIKTDLIRQWDCVNVFAQNRHRIGKSPTDTIDLYICHLSNNCQIMFLASGTLCTCVIFTNPLRYHCVSMWHFLNCCMPIVYRCDIFWLATCPLCISVMFLFLNWYIPIPYLYDIFYLANMPLVYLCNMFHLATCPLCICSIVSYFRHTHYPFTLFRHRIKRTYAMDHCEFLNCRVRKSCVSNQSWCVQKL